MSYVLDALRRADAERSRGEMPGLQTQPVPVLSGAPSAAAAPAAWRRAGLVLVLALAGALGAWWLLAQPGPASLLAPAATPTPAQTPTPATATAAAPALASPPLTLPPVPRSAAQPAPAPTPTASAALPATTSAPVPASAPATAPVRIPLFTELPESFRRSVPALSFGGSMDSPQPAQRMLIVNGQVLHEGDQPLPGLTLQTIRLRSAVFDYKGTRFEVSY